MKVYKRLWAVESEAIDGGWGLVLCSMSETRKEAIAKAKKELDGVICYYRAVEIHVNVNAVDQKKTLNRV